MNLDEALAAALGAIDFPKGHPLYRFGTWRLELCGPWDITYNGHRPTWQAWAHPYNATGNGLDRPIEGLGGSPVDALTDLIAKIAEER